MHKAAIVLVVVTLLTSHCAAQANPSDIRAEDRVNARGTITDADGKPVPDVTIKTYRLENPPAGAAGKKFGVLVARVKSGADGTFEIKNLPPGKYRYRVGPSKTTGFAGGTFEVKDNEPQSLNICLRK